MVFFHTKMLHKEKKNKLTLKQKKKLGQVDLLPWFVLATGCCRGH